MKKTIIFVSVVICLVTSCGKDDSSSNQSNSSSPVSYSGEAKCLNPIRNLSGCCSYHNGAKACGNPGQYEFDSDDRLVCNDETLSPSCKRY